MMSSAKKNWWAVGFSWGVLGRLMLARLLSILRCMTVCCWSCGAGRPHKVLLDQKIFPNQVWRWTIDSLRHSGWRSSRFPRGTWLVHISHSLGDELICRRPQQSANDICETRDYPFNPNENLGCGEGRGKIIPWQEKAKYLGIILHSRLTFRKHFNEVLSKFLRATVRQIQCLFYSIKVNATSKYSRAWI